MIFNQNISFGKFTNAIISVMALAWTFVSCVQIEENRQGTGYITFSPITVDYSVENLVPTKAAVPAEDLPSAEDFTVTISGGSLQEPIVYAPGTLPAGQIQLEVGEYDVEASYGSNIFNNPYFYASTTVEIGLGEVKEVSLNDVPLENSMVAVLLPDDFSDHMTVSSILLSDDSGSLEVQAGKYYYAPSGREVSLTFAGTNSAGQEKTISLSLGVLKPHHAYDVKCNMDLPTLSFTNQAGGAWASRLYLTSLATSDQTIDNDLVIYKISTDGTNWDNVDPVQKDGYWVIEGLVNNTKYYIKAVYGALETVPWEFTPVLTSNLSLDLSHTYSSGYLNGTSAVVSGDVSYPSIVASLIASKGSLGAELYSSSDVLVRTITSKTGTMSDTNGWPYLPQGDYTLKPYYQIGSDKVYLPSVEDTAGSPSFTVTAAPMSAFSYYKRDGADTANSVNGSDIWIETNITISDNILGNSNYNEMLACVYSFKSPANESVNTKVYISNSAYIHKDSHLADLKWQQHSIALSCKATFDGVEDMYEITTSCHVTGIPYFSGVPSNSGNHPWSKHSDHGNITWKEDCVELYYSSNRKPIIVSPIFHIPENINISVPSKASRNNFAARGNYQIGLDVEEPGFLETGGDDITSLLLSSNFAGGSTYEDKVNGTMTASFNKLYVGHDYYAGGPYIYIHYVNVLYR